MGIEDLNPQVYYMWSDAYPVVKIGTSKDFMKRGEQLSRLYPEFGNGGDYYILNEPGGYEEERQRHAQFHRSRIGGEFFLLTPDLRAHLDQLHEGRIRNAPCFHMTEEEIEAELTAIFGPR